MLLRFGRKPDTKEEGGDRRGHVRATSTHHLTIRSECGKPRNLQKMRRILG